MAIEAAPVLSKERERELLEQSRCASGNREEARQALIEANLRWVWKVASRYVLRGVDLEDLFQFGILGLIQAIDEFDLSKNVRLSTYSTFIIKRTILAETEMRAAIISVPGKYKREHLTDDMLRERVDGILQHMASLSSMGRSNESEKLSRLRHKDLAWSETLRVYETASETLETKELIRRVRRAIYRLPRWERVVVRLRMQGRTREEIAVITNRHKESVRRIVRRAEPKLKRILFEMGLGQ